MAFPTDQCSERENWTVNVNLATLQKGALMINDAICKSFHIMLNFTLGSSIMSSLGSSVL